MIGNLNGCATVAPRVTLRTLVPSGSGIQQDAPVMTPDEMKDFYLAKAKEAETEERRALDPQRREYWKKMANDYRKMAERASPSTDQGN